MNLDLINIHIHFFFEKEIVNSAQFTLGRVFCLFSFFNAQHHSGKFVQNQSKIIDFGVQKCSGYNCLGIKSIWESKVLWGLSGKVGQNILQRLSVTF